MKRIPTKTTYLEMRSPRMPEVAAPALEITMERVLSPSVEHYRFLYNSVGKDYHWVDRNLLADDPLRRILEDDRVEIYLLQVAGQPAGYSELDRRTPGQIELAYFGLFPEFTGKGLGKYFLYWTLCQAWSYQPGRVWVHTCDLDHQAALPLYRKAGFSVYDERVIEQVVPSPKS
jgi:GNAT superfamily N-acetyltransferase